MRLSVHLLRFFTASLLLWLVGCSTLEQVLPMKKVDYKTSHTLPPLEVPPSLSTPTTSGLPVGATSYSEYMQSQTGDRSGNVRVLPSFDQITVKGEGDKRWLVANAQPDALWNNIRTFWTQAGFKLVMENPSLGIMETNWAENRADITDGPIRRLLGKVLDGLYSAATRDRFRVRLDYDVENKKTEIFIIHRGMEEIVEGSVDEGAGTRWRQRDNDPELEIEMLRSLMIYLGVNADQAANRLSEKQAVVIRAQLINKNDELTLIVTDSFSRTWRRTGIALDRVGFAVEDRDRSQGVYFVRYRDPFQDEAEQGFLEKWLPWGGSETTQQNYQIHLSTEAATTRIEILNETGQVDHSSTAVRILKLLEEQLK